jgi:hypothetical protein
MRAIAVLAISLLLGGAVRGAGSAEAAQTLRDMIAAVNHISALLEGIRDDASADAALPGLEQGAQRVKDLEKKLAAYPLTDAEKKKLRQEHRQEVEKAITRLYAAARQAGMRAPKKALQIQAALSKAK